MKRVVAVKTTMTLTNNNASRANRMLSPTRPSSSVSSSSSSSSSSFPAYRIHDNEEKALVVGVDLAQLKVRFDKQLPKYGFLWRSMANARLAKDVARSEDGVIRDKENINPPSDGINDSSNSNGGGDAESSTSTTQTTLLDAILNKQPVSLRVASRSSPNHEVCGDDCDCADPIIEIIDNEDASVYDVNVDEELADSSDSDEESSLKKTNNTAFELDDEMNEAINYDHQSNAPLEDESEDDESVVLVSRTPKKKMFIIDSDDEDGCESNEREGENNDESSKSISTYGISSTSSRRTSSRLQTSKPKIDVESNDDESEKEWLEISSSEEDKALPPRRQNTIVILSDDEEDSKSDDDNDDEQSAFTISDDSDSSEGSDRSSIPKTTRGGGEGYASRVPSSGKESRKVIVREKPAERITISKSHISQRNNSRSTFRKDRDAITSRTFAEFNKLAFNNQLSAVEVNWSNKLNTTAGITRMRGKLGEKNSHTRIATIELATKVIDDEERLRATLLHELCHAAQWLVDGIHKPPHGSSFKKWAALATRVIGDVEVTTTHDYQIAYKYAWACTASNCKVVIKRHSRSVDPTKHCCGRCKGKLVEIEVPGSKGDTDTRASYTQKKERKTSDFALFVKQQTPDVRCRLARERSCSSKEVAQSDVMKECGKLWRSRKDAESLAAKAGQSVEDQLSNLAL